MAEQIIYQRITHPEGQYKRINRLCLELINESPDLNISTLFGELDNYEMLFTKFQLQLQSNKKEMARYKAQMEENTKIHEDLLIKTAQLEHEFEQAQKSKEDKHELNNIIADMIKPKQVEVDVGKGKTQIIALLNQTRAHDTEVIQSLKEDISELESQFEQYRQAWSVKQSRFREMMDTLEVYKQEILGREEDEDEDEMDIDNNGNENDKTKETEVDEDNERRINQDKEVEEIKETENNDATADIEMKD